MTDRKKLAQKFAKTLRRDKRGPLDLTCFCPERWFAGSYITIQRTLRVNPDHRCPHKTLSDKQKQQAADLVFSELPRLRPDSFRRQWDSLLKGLVKLSGKGKQFRMSYGHAQKLASLLVKYVYVSGELGAKLPRDLKAAIQKCRNVLPVPIDQQMVAALSTDKRVVKELGDADTPTRQRILRRTSIKVPEGYWVAWSRLNDAGTYWRIQDAVKRIHRDGIMLDLSIWDRR